MGDKTYIKYILKEYSETNFEKVLREITSDDTIKLLPLIHNVDGIKVRDTVKNANDYFENYNIEPVMCDVFGENLVYTFVGRPAYNETFFPVCFIIEPAEELLTNIFVFDTGAYVGSRYEQLADNVEDINRFRVPATSEYIRKLISHFYKNNINYYLSASCNYTDITNIETMYDDFFLYEILSGIRKFSTLKFDTRCRTIENIVRKPIDLKKYLKAIIVSSEQSRTSEFKNFISKLDRSVDVIKYYTFDLNAGSECNREIKELLFNYYFDKELI